MSEIVARTDLDLAGIAVLELAAEKTALCQRVYYNPEGVRRLLAASSANGRWSYEREGRVWVVIDRTERESLFFESGLDPARRRTFEIDHPMHTVEPEPKPVRWSF